MRADRSIFCMLLALFALLAGCRPIQPVAAPPAATLELIDRIGGPSLAVAVQDHYAYVSFSREFAVLDIRDPRAPRQVGQMTLGGAVNDLALQDGYLYLAVEGQGLTVLNVLDAPQPVLVAQIDNVDDPRSVAIAGNTIYLAAGFDGVLVYRFVPPVPSP